MGITSDDGLALNGVYYENTDSHLWVITLHGYRSDHRAGVAAAQHFYDAGYQVLSPDLRACGDSEGDYVGMGWLDRKDVLDWVDWVTGQDTVGGNRTLRSFHGGSDHDDDFRGRYTGSGVPHLLRTAVTRVYGISFPMS